MHEAQAERLAKELVRAVRGKRTQTALSRALGYRSNIAHRWETGECFPTAAVFLSACARLRPSSKALFVRFFKRAPSWLDAREPFSPAQVSAFLQELRGKTPINTLAQQSPFTRYQITRWLRGQTQPKLPEFLCLVEVSSRRALDLVAELCDPTQLPSVAERWLELSRARELAYTSPWSQAVLHALELDAYESTPIPEAMTFLASRLGVDEQQVRTGLRVLRDSGQIRKKGGRYRPHRVLSIDTSHDAERSRALKVAWTELALERMRKNACGSFGYSVFAVSRSDLARLRDLHLEYVRAMQAIVAASRPNECVALYCAQLLDLSGDG